MRERFGRDERSRQHREEFRNREPNAGRGSDDWRISPDQHDERYAATGRASESAQRWEHDHERVGSRGPARQFVGPSRFDDDEDERWGGFAPSRSGWAAVERDEHSGRTFPAPRGSDAYRGGQTYSGQPLGPHDHQDEHYRPEPDQRAQYSRGPQYEAGFPSRHGYQWQQDRPSPGYQRQEQYGHWPRSERPPQGAPHEDAGGFEVGRSVRDAFGVGRRGEGHVGRGPKGYQRSDERIREDVCDRLGDDPHVDASDITVTVSGGEVTFEGTVETRRMKHRAEDLVEDVSGVRDVHNRLRVRKGMLTEMSDRLSGHENDQTYEGQHVRASSTTPERPGRATS
jgi:hypothetical protein